ncbi:glycosyltransferase family 2 protein [Botryobacter ruber]|uniref:glycosyltransferase family 2 protein n=1 Tax=Botryobacter ruber TaxID=2171629 RepID=UPI000E0C0AC4|nr:glycosyltransferase family 2 protein [Botryobacter ruber]
MEVSLSVVIITYNEEQNIARCLDSVEGIADDVVVVDSFSTDKTKAICLNRGVRFVERPFDGYVTQKNFANAQAAFPHILSLDADEVLSEELQQEVRALKQNWQLGGYYLSRLTNYCGAWVRHGGWYPDLKLRLYDRRQGQWEGLLLHEKFELAAGARSGAVKGDLLHYSYTSIKQHLDQINHFTEVALEEMKQQGKQVSVLGLIVKPPFRFLKMYFLQLGFLDGFAGFCIAVLSSYAVFAKYAKLYLFHKQPLS